MKTASGEKAGSGLPGRNKIKMMDNSFNPVRLLGILDSSEGVSTDSRTIRPGEIFFALKGDNFDGNAYAIDALRKGARFAVVDRRSRAADILAGGTEPDFSERYMLSDDTLQSLQELARLHRSRFDIPLILLTGTNGKTTTKELLRSVLSMRYDTLSTEGNLNNHIGLPLTLLRLGRDTRIAVIEAGANHPGEIAALASMAMPGYGLVTNVGIAHLEGFGSFEGVKKAKGELYDHLLETGGKAFLNADDPLLTGMASERPGLSVIRYGLAFQGAYAVHASGGEICMGLSLPEDITPDCACGAAGGRMLSVQTALAGDYNAANVMAAINVGLYFGVPLKDCLKAVGAYRPSNRRSQLVHTGRNTVILDAYNANPSSMRASIANFASLDVPDKIMVLGDMLELGAYSEEGHSMIVDMVSRMDFRVCCFVGREFARFRDKGDPRFVFFGNADAAAGYFAADPPSGATVLVKGSNGVGLSRIVDVL